MSNRRLVVDCGKVPTSARACRHSHVAVESLEPRALLAVVTGAMAQFQAVTISFNGPQASEMQSNPNPFLDYRLQVNVTSPSGKLYSLPGFFNGDGVGGGTGKVWQAKFSPDEAGSWRYSASFRAGSRVAIDLNPSAGTPTSFNGESGTFAIGGKKSAPGFTGNGRLEYAGGHYLRFKDGTYFVKAGANEPENFLGYTGFDNTPNGWHKYQPHVADWKTGDPDWGNGRGKAIIGAVNYFASTGLNALCFLTQNVGGQTKDVWPWAGNINRAGSPGNDNLHYDISKLGQWDIVFNHMQRKGIALHFVFAETEEATKKELDNATLGTERKLYYRELIARFGYHNALQWNINEEYCWRYAISPELIKDWAGYIRAVDPFDRPLTVHSQGYQQRTWGYFVGDNRFDMTSLQYYKDVAGYGKEVEYWRDRTRNSGRPLVVSIDEARETTDTNQTTQRKEFLWPTLLSGGNLEWSTITFAWNDNMRRYDQINRDTGKALAFMKMIPFWQMNPADGLVTGETGSYGGAQVFAKANDTYAVYFPNASATGSINLAGASGSFVARWFNPRSGAFEGSSKTFSGGGVRAIGAAPSDSSNDWALLIARSISGSPSVGSPAPAAPTPTPTDTSVVLPAVTRLRGMNPDTGQPYSKLTNLTDNMTINLADMPTRKWTVDAAISGTVKSVKFVLNGRTTIENAAPWAMVGDHADGRLKWETLAAGRYTLSVTPYTAAGATGTAGVTRTIRLNVVNAPYRTAAPMPEGDEPTFAAQLIV